MDWRTFLTAIPFALACIIPGEVYAQCAASYTFEDDGLTIQFFDASDPGPGDEIVQWQWDFDDGGESNIPNPLHTFNEPNEFTVCLTITTADNCTDQVCVDIQICTLLLDVNVATECDVNGEIEVSLVVSDPFDEAISVNISLDGTLLPGSPFDIDDVAPVMQTLSIPGDGLMHTLLVQSEEVGHCNAELSFMVPDCNSNCFLSALSTEFSGGQTYFVSIGDNFFSPVNLEVQAGDVVHWDWVGDGHSTTSDATTGPDSWNSGVLGQGAAFEVTIHNPGVHPYYCIPHGGPGGVGMSATIVANCPPDNNFDLTISFNSTIADPQGFDLLIDNVLHPNSPFSYNGVGMTSIVLPISGDGQTHDLLIRDVADPSCTLAGSYSAPDCGAAPTCTISVSAMQTGGCDGQNQVQVELSVSDINGGAGGFNILVDGAPAAGPIAYDPSGTTLANVQVPGDGAEHVITVRDADDPICMSSTTITTINCTVACELSALSLSTGDPVTHLVDVQDFQFSPKDITISSGDQVEWQWIGDVQHTSTSDATSGPDSWDSGLLGNGGTFLSPVLSEGVHPYYCIPHGGPGGVGMSGTITVQAPCTGGMVDVAVTFTESGGGFSGFDVLVDGLAAPSGPYQYDASGLNTVVIAVPGDGAQHLITVRDVEDPSCTVSSTITTPDCSASTCQLIAGASLAGSCNENGLVPVMISVTDVGGGSGGFNILVDGTPTGDGPYPYDASGTTTVEILTPGDGQDHTFLVQDIDDPGCLSADNLQTPDCSLDCQILGLSASLGEPATHTVEVQDFAFSPKHVAIAVGDTVRFVWVGSVEHTSTSDATTGNNVWDSGLQGQGAVYDVIITEAGVHPYYCIPHGGPGGVGMSGTITALADCENDSVQVILAFDAMGGSVDGFNMTVDGNLVPGGPFTYVQSGQTTAVVPVPGDGQSHSVAIIDAGDNQCTAAIDVTTPDCNAIECNIALDAQVGGGCNTQNMVAVTLTVSASGTSTAGFNIFVDGIIHPESPFDFDASGTTMVQVLVPGDGQAHQLFVFDVGNVNCGDTVTVSTADCGEACILGNFTIGYATPSTHIIEVRDFEFFPDSLGIYLGDTVRYIWTGDVAHTATSDATEGPDVFNSGLWGNGHIFEVILTESGLHPYYCIPHGGPGGVGMSGVINVEEICAGGVLPVTMTFSATNGSFEGYVVEIDGEPIADPGMYSSGEQEVMTTIPGDGSSHTVTIRDLGDPNCRIDTVLAVPDCNDACFGFESGFDFQIDYQTSTVTFTNTSSPEASMLTWLFGDGEMSDEADPIHQYDTADVFEVCLVAEDGMGCTDTTCDMIVLGEFICSPAFGVESDGLQIQVSDSSTTSIPVASWIWSFGDGGASVEGPSVAHTYDTLGLYEVCLTIQADSCVSTHCELLDLTNPCLLTSAEFTYFSDGASGVQFQSQATGNPTTVLWGFGDGQISNAQNPFHSYSNPGTYTVCLLVIDNANNCSAHACSEVEILATGIANGGASMPLLIFPNPSKISTSVFLTGLAPVDIGRPADLHILSLTGQLVNRSQVTCDKLTEVNLRFVPRPGMYVLHLRAEHNTYVGKLIIH